jgi:Xaa-Pro aminopeptidase
METVQPILRRGREVWDRINMPEMEYRQRILRIQETMKKENLDVLLVYGAGLNGYGNAAYLSNYATKMPWGAFVIVPQEGDVTLLFQGGSRELKAVQKITWIEDIRSSMTLTPTCLEQMKEKDFIPSRVGIAGPRKLMPVHEFQSLLEGTSRCEVIEADHILNDMRMIKSPRECDQMRRSSRIVAHGFDFIADTPFTDPTERSLDALVDREMRLEGVEDVRLLFGKPKETSWAMRPAEELRLSNGDTVILYLAVSFERYWAEGIRTYTFKDTRFTTPAVGKGTALYLQVISEMKPEKKASAYHEAVHSEFKNSGLESISDYGLGQGIGLDLHEPPYLNDSDQTRMKSGMCVAIRLTMKDNKIGAIMTGDTFLLTENGPEKLTA